MHRPCFLIAEPKPHEGLSSRKLVLETGGFNVVTAYSGAEVLDSLRRFPGADAVIIHSELSDMECGTVAEKVRQLAPQMKIIVLAPRLVTRCAHADEHLDSHEPEQLLELAKKLFGDPRTMGGQDL